MARLSMRARVALRRLVDDIVAGRYSALESDGRIGRLTGDEVRRAIEVYGRKLMTPPPDAIDSAEAYPVENLPKRFAIDLPLWTEEEGRSDLTLLLRLDDAGDEPRVSIDDLRVL
ncbi:MAG: hypothetical protein HY908_20955 [Myxococcales bacterium]|nr:hypothetical protein [Myxococcales bacterium]